MAQGQLVVRPHWAPGVEQTALWDCLSPVPILGSGSALRAAVFIYILFEPLVPDIVTYTCLSKIPDHFSACFIYRLFP